MINQTKISETRNGIALQIQTWNSNTEWCFRSKALNVPEWKMQQRLCIIHINYNHLHLN